MAVILAGAGGHQRLQQWHFWCFCHRLVVAGPLRSLIKILSLASASKGADLTLRRSVAFWWNLAVRDEGTLHASLSAANDTAPTSCGQFLGGMSGSPTTMWPDGMEWMSIWTFKSVVAVLVQGGSSSCHNENVLFVSFCYRAHNQSTKQTEWYTHHLWSVLVDGEYHREINGLMPIYCPSISNNFTNSWWLFYRQLPTQKACKNNSWDQAGHFDLHKKPCTITSLQFLIHTLGT